MAEFTNKQKSNQPSEELFLLIDDAVNFLLIDDNSNRLILQEFNQGIRYSNRQKTN